MKKAFLLLENGSLYEGIHRGADGLAIGEVIFHTGVASYQDVLTSPAYFGQMVCMTYPLIGNYGMTCEHGETDRPWLSGFIVSKLSDTPSNWRSKETVDEYLKRTGVVTISEIDTRKLTRELRNGGIQNGAIFSEDVQVDRAELLEKLRTYKIQNAVETVVSDNKEELFAGDGKSVAVLDFGVKSALVGALSRRGAAVTTIKGNAATIDQLSKFDGVVLSDGPGDPSENTAAIKTVAALIEKKIPTFGAGLGHQILALAIGASMERLQHGHHGGNYPVTDVKLGKTFITSQNHNYVVSEGSIDSKIATVSHRNLNDQSVEGIALLDAPASSVQFMPEGYPGPHDTEYLMDAFMEQVNKNGGNQ